MPTRLRAPLHLALAIALVLTAALLLRPRPVAAAHPFVDVGPADPAATAIDRLYARGVIKGYPTEPPTFGPGDTSLRAQMAALIGRGMAWEAGGANPFADRCDATGCIDDELWGYVAALAGRNVAKGYDATTFGPLDNVLKQQVILFIARAKVAKGDWVRQPDESRVYPGAAGSPADHQDIVTYVFYAGAPPDAPTTYDTAWADFNGEATRGWFARALWQAYPEGKGPALQSGPAPGASPGTSAAPSASPSARPGSSPSPSASGGPSPSATPSPSPSSDPGGQDIPTSPDTAAFVAEVLRLTNEQRVLNGCEPLTYNQRLRNAAQAHAVDMATRDYLDHYTPEGASFADRVTAAGYSWRGVSENIGGGYLTPQAVVDGWMASELHRANILRCARTEIGIGYYYLADDPGTINVQHYWVQILATPR